jgi:hypothetical protein
MADLHIYAETGAIGDTALNLCRINVALSNSNCEKAVVHTSPILKANGLQIKTNPIVHEILKRTSFIREVVTDVDHNDRESFTKSKIYGVPIHQPFEFREKNNILDWVDLKEFIPEKSEVKTALFQPISLKTKPKKHLDDYIPVWDRCLKTLIKKGYRIVMVGAEDDPIDLCVNKKHMSHIVNQCGSWSMLESIAFTLYEADVVLSCDSWAGLWGAAARKPTAIAWGYRMENNIDYWVTNFLGNRDIYEYGWSSQKDYCDAHLAHYLSAL